MVLSNPNDPPLGAIENGREVLRRLVDHYDFQCDAGPLVRCMEFDELRQCFEAMAVYITEMLATETPE